MEHPVRKLRLQKAWSQEQLAQLAGISARTVQRLENGDTPSLETLAALAAVSDVPVTELQQTDHLHVQTQPVVTTYIEPASTDASAMSVSQDHTRRFWRLLVVCGMVSLGLLMLNAGQDGGRWWAGWPILGMSIAVLVRAWRAFAPPAWRSKGRGEAAT